MTTARAHERAPHLEQAAPVWDPLGTKLEDLVREGVGACLVEDPHGRVVCHALAQNAPEAAVRAVLSRDSAHLHRAVSGLRTTGRVSGGPLLTGSVDDWPGAVSIVPLAGAGHLWVFGSRATGLAQARSLSSSLGALLQCMHTEATEPRLHERLHGQGPAVAAVDGWVAVLRERDQRAWDPLALQRLLVSALTGCAGLEVTVTRSQAFVVLRESDANVARGCLDAVMSSVADTLGVTLVGALAPTTSGLAHARQIAERALTALATPGRCVTVEQARSAETVQRALDGVRSLPPLGSDPLAALIAAGEPVVTALRAWLDAHGDVPTAAARSGLHPNTLRYRIKRALALLPADLTDPVARLEIHLRLLAVEAAPEPSRHQ